MVVKDTEPWSIYVGSPAKKIKDRPKGIMLSLEKKCYDLCFDEDGKYSYSKDLC